MVTLSPPREWVDALLRALDGAQQGVRALLHQLGLTGDAHGQPAWPFTWRIAAEMIAADPSLARALLMVAACLAVAAMALLWGAAWRRGRPWLWGGAVALSVCAPWPAAYLWWTPAVPTSLHASPTGDAAQSIMRGQALYTRHCARCHGADGRSEGPDAARQARWPTALHGALLWKRLDGELFWRVQHGMRGRDGQPTMPGFARHLNDADTWAVLDYARALASGQALQEAGSWLQPVRLPNAVVHCARNAATTLSDLRGRRLMLAVGEPRTDRRADPLPPDPLFVRIGVGAAAKRGDWDCVSDDPDLPRALAVLNGASAEGAQFIADRDGWLRARNAPDATGWSASDLVCSSARSPVAADASADGLVALVVRIDADPVRARRGGFPH